MLPLRHAKRWRIASVVLLIAVLFATLMPAVWFIDNRVQALSWFRGVDKWLHGIVFFTLALWFAGMVRRNAYWRVAIGLLAFGIGIEICQRMVGYRSAEWYDVAADAAGIVIGLIVALAGAGGWCLHFENRFLPGSNTSDNA